MWDVQHNLSEQVFPRSLMIQEECDYSTCVCETGKGKVCTFFCVFPGVQTWSLFLWGVAQGHIPQEERSQSQKIFIACPSNMKLI
jgi:hypothetical protein